MLARTIQNLLPIASFMTEPKKQPCLPTLLHTFIVARLVQFFFQPSLFLRGNRGSPGLAAATGRYGFCVQMGITSFLPWVLPLSVLRLIGHGFNAVSCTEEPLREAVFFQIPLLLPFGKAAKGFPAAIADEESTGNNVHYFMGIPVPDGPV